MADLDGDDFKKFMVIAKHMQRNEADKFYPILKWAGGKRVFADRYYDYFPKTYNVYHEPFVGGGAVFLRLSPPRAVLSDINPKLINVYNAVKNNVESLIDILKELEWEHNLSPSGRKAYYYDMLDLFNKDKNISDVRRAAIFIYLNRTGFNGVYRENSRGEYNIPFGLDEPRRILFDERLRIVSSKLQNAELHTELFDGVLSRANTGDFVFLDPPYVPQYKAKFTGYNSGKFTLEDQRRVLNVVNELSDRGCLVMLCNSDTPFTRELYSSYNITDITIRKYINNKRNDSNQEILVTNY